MFLLFLYFQRYISFFTNNILNIFPVCIFNFNRHFFTIEASQYKIQIWLVLRSSLRATARERGNLIMLRKKMRLLHHFVLRKNIFNVASATPEFHEAHCKFDS
jgi:hypothetical protein